MLSTITTNAQKMNDMIKLFISNMVVLPMAFSTKSQPVSQVSFIFMRFIRPVYLTFCKAICFAKFASTWFTKSLYYPVVERLIPNSISFPIWGPNISKLCVKFHALVTTTFSASFNLTRLCRKYFTTLYASKFDLFSKRKTRVIVGAFSRTKKKLLFVFNFIRYVPNLSGELVRTMFTFHIFSNTKKDTRLAEGTHLCSQAYNS